MRHFGGCVRVRPTSPLTMSVSSHLGILGPSWTFPIGSQKVTFPANLAEVRWGSLGRLSDATHHLSRLSVAIHMFCDHTVHDFQLVSASYLSSLFGLTLKGPGGGGGIHPLDISRDNFVDFFFRAASFHDFFLWSLAQLLALFSEKLGVRFQSYAKLCNRASAQNYKIFWICVQNIWKMASWAKTPFWALKCSICFHYS